MAMLQLFSEVMRDECAKNGVKSSLLGNDPFVCKYGKGALRACMEILRRETIRSEERRVGKECSW